MAAKIAWQVGRVKRFYVIVECEKESSSETESQKRVVVSARADLATNIWA